jgi:hypothetical protein
VRRQPELLAPGHRVRADPQLLAAVQRVRQAGTQPVVAPLPASVAARQACRVPGDRSRVAVPPGRGGRSREVATQGRGDAGAGEVRGLCRAKEALSTWESAAGVFGTWPGQPTNTGASTVIIDP